MRGTPATRPAATCISRSTTRGSGRTRGTTCHKKGFRLAGGGSRKRHGRQIQTLDVLAEHAGRAELPDRRLNGGAHGGQPGRRQAVGVALIEARNDLLLQDPIQLDGIGLVLWVLVADGRPPADRPSVAAVEAL